MQIHRDFEQGSEAWFRIKHGKIGGTRAKGLYVDSETLTLDILSERVEEFDEDDDDNYASEAMMYGIDLEPQARFELGKYTSLFFEEVAWIQSGIPILGVSTDGLTKDETIACEIKCPQRKKHVLNCLEPGISKDYIHQCIHNFTCNDKLKTLYFASYRPQNNLVPLSVRKLTRDSIVDVGFKKDGKIWEDRGKGLKEYVDKSPDLRTVQEWVEFSKIEALKIEVEVRKYIEKLSF
jgi:hypothetical protein